METPISITLSLLALTFLMTHAWRAYMVDRHRLRLFLLRDRLFDVAADGKVPFDHRAYVMLRSLINGHIRFGARIDLVYGILHKLLVAQAAAPVESTLEASWVGARDALPTEVRKELEAIRAALHHETLVQVLFGEVFWVPIWGVMLVLAIAVALVESLAKSPVQLLAKTRAAFERRVDRLETQWDAAALCSH